MSGSFKKKDISKMEGSINNDNNLQGEVLSSLEEINEDSSINKNENPGKDKEEDFIAKLECGHSFHGKCIASWMAKQNNCPVCREKIDKDDSSQNNGNKSTNGTRTDTASTNNLTQSLIDIQTVLHPNFRYLRFTHSPSSFSWAYRSNVGSSTGSSKSSSWGTSSSWGGGSSGGGSTKW